MKSILQDENKCLICEMPEVEEHHVFQGFGKREISEREGLKVFLCPFHHRIGKNSIHFNKELDLKIKRFAEKKWLEYNNKTVEDFIQLMGKNWL